MVKNLGMALNLKLQYKEKKRSQGKETDWILNSKKLLAPLKKLLVCKNKKKIYSVNCCLLKRIQGCEIKVYNIKTAARIKKSWKRLSHRKGEG